MRIIGGRLKGKPIQPPMGYGARPTTDFAREGLFNVLDNEYEFANLQVLEFILVAQDIEKAFTGEIRGRPRTIAHGGLDGFALEPSSDDPHRRTTDLK